MPASACQLVIDIALTSPKKDNEFSDRIGAVAVLNLRLFRLLHHRLA